MKPASSIRPSKVYAMVTSLVPAPSCRMSPNVHTRVKPATDFSAYHSFAELPLPEAALADIPAPTWQLPPAREGLWRSRITEAG